MNREEAKQYIIEHPEVYLTRDGSKKGYICPICGSGSGHHGTGITENPNNPYHFTCWSKCETQGDVLEFIGKKFGLSDYNDILRKACDIYGINYDNLTSDYIPSIKQDTTAKPHGNLTETKKAVVKEEPSQEAFIAECAKHIEDTDYLLNRGISIETQKRFNVGFCKEWRNPKAPATAPTTPRVIIPTSKTSYLARDARPSEYLKTLNDLDYSTYERYSKQKVGTITPFNLQALEQNAPCFITEGEIDAMSIEELGFNCVGLGGATNARKVAEYIKQQTNTPRIILYLDDDEAGRKAQSTIEEVLKEQNKPYVVMKPTGYKDPNEYLNAFREAMKSDLEDAIKEFDREKEEQRLEYLGTATNFYIEDFMNRIKESENREATPTGFEELDKALDGGLYEGLYTIGAISSLGKTTFMLQVADQIAQKGQDVLIYSLEMSRDELIAKSISRLTASIDLDRNGNTSHAKTTRGIMQGKFYKVYSQEEKDLIAEAVDLYRQPAKHTYIKEGNGATIEDIKKEIVKHHEATGKAPVVIIDYLQIITTDDNRKTDKQAMDLNVSELKRISRDYKTPVVVISSFNRGNYSTPVDMESFKESGAIEYSSDVLIGLQLGDVFTGSNETDPDKHKGEIKKLVREAKAKNPRPVELVILKNRNGAIPKAPIKYKFYPMFNLFNEDTGNATQDYYKKKYGY